jgi:predicted DCC family thiol-disulfide oxidoreductase YuxK
MSEPQPGTALVLYDVDCGFCRWTLAGLLRWDRGGRLRAAAIQDAEGERVLSGMDPEVRMQSWHFLTPDGRLLSAGRALPDVLTLLPGGRQLSWATRVLMPLTERAYRLVARSRGRLGPLLSERARARATALVAKRSSPDSLVHRLPVSAIRPAGTAPK